MLCLHGSSRVPPGPPTWSAAEHAHILESLLGAPPVTLATLRAPSSCLRSLSCRWQEPLLSPSALLSPSSCIKAAWQLDGCPTHLALQIRFVLRPQLMGLDFGCGRHTSVSQNWVNAGGGARSVSGPWPGKPQVTLEHDPKLGHPLSIVDFCRRSLNSLASLSRRCHLCWSGLCDTGRFLQEYGHRLAPARQKGA